MSLYFLHICFSEQLPEDWGSLQGNLTTDIQDADELVAT